MATAELIFPQVPEGGGVVPAVFALGNTFSPLELAGTIQDYSTDTGDQRVAYWYCYTDENGIPLAEINDPGTGLPLGEWVASEIGVKVKAPSEENGRGSFLLNMEATALGLSTTPVEIRFVTFNSSNYTTDLSVLAPSFTLYETRIQLRQALPEEEISIPSFNLYAESNSGYSRVVTEFVGTDLPSDFRGFYFYASLVPGGPYAKLNPSPVTIPTKFYKAKNPETTKMDYIGSLEVETTIYSTEDRIQFVFPITPTALEEIASTGKDVPGFTGGVQEGTTLYFIATQVYSANLVESQASILVEDYPSVEVSTRYVNPFQDLISLPTRAASDISESMAASIINRNPDAVVFAGSPIRDILDPIAIEMQNLYLMQDFAFKMSSWSLLESFDDPNGDGETDPFTTGTEKETFRVSGGMTATQAQEFINTMFDLKAKDDGVYRMPAKPASGSVVFFTSSVPADGFFVGRGTVVYHNSDQGPISFLTESVAYISFEDKDFFFNPEQNRYEVSVPITCVFSGVEGNLTSGLITETSWVPTPGAGVINYQPTSNGANRESNSSLAARSRLSKVGKDKGTQFGYELTARSTPGVRDALVIPAGHPLMKRDFDRQSLSHRGGAVDIYLRGQDIQNVEDIIAMSPSFGVAQNFDERFQIVSASRLIFRSRNPKANPQSPISSVKTVYNASKKEFLSTAGIQVGLGDGDMISLSMASNFGIVVDPTDVILVTYSLRVSTDLKLSQSPASSISSVYLFPSGQLVPQEYYTLVHSDAPTHTGMSSRSESFLRFDIDWVKSSGLDQLKSTQERLSVRVGKRVALRTRGVDLASIRAFDSDGSELEKDLDYSTDFDDKSLVAYFIAEVNGSIGDGETVTLVFNCGQNYRVIYTVDRLVSQVQSTIDKDRHLGADVLVKSSVRNNVSLNLAVSRVPGSSQSQVEGTIKQRIRELIEAQPLGATIKLDDIISFVKTLNTVHKVYTPSIMCRAPGSLIINERLGRNISFREYNSDPSTGIRAFVSIKSVMDYKPKSSGADKGLYKAIYENDLTLDMVDDPNEVCKGPGRGCILGDGRIVVTTTDLIPPQTKTYYCTYYTQIADKADDIVCSPIEYLSYSADSVVIDASEVYTPLRR